jgi:uncharacterized protein YneF (UPF0154 family)
MASVIITIVVGLAALLIGLLVGYILRKSIGEKTIGNAETKARNMLGRKQTPPRRAVAFLCIFRELGMSYRFFSSQKFMITGMEKNPHPALSRNANIRSSVSVIYRVDFYVYNRKKTQLLRSTDYSSLSNKKYDNKIMVKN